MTVRLKRHLDLVQMHGEALDAANQLKSLKQLGAQTRLVWGEIVTINQFGAVVHLLPVPADQVMPVSYTHLTLPTIYSV